MQLAEDAARHGADAALRRWLDHDRPLPGFGHPLYPDGDVRADALLEAIEVDATLQSVRVAAFAATGARPNIDFALAAMTRGFHLPPDAPFRLFALARSVGWTAHVVEQVTGNGLIRPRARYEGPSPAGAISLA
jgi:citrate synthase